MVRKKVKVFTRGKENNCRTSSSCFGAGYFLGFLGSLVYYISISSGFWMGVLGLLKAFVWPAFLVYELLKFIGA